MFLRICYDGDFEDGVAGYILQYGGGEHRDELACEAEPKEWSHLGSRSIRALIMQVAIKVSKMVKTVVGLKSLKASS